MQTGLVSVMMPAFNAGAYIGQAIASVLAQSYADWELLVVNDGSTDATEEIARRFQDPRVRVFSKPNGGESSARNLALDHSRGEFIAYLDADDAYLPEHLALAVQFLREHPERDAVYTDGIHIDERGRRLTSLQSRRRGPFEGRLFDELVRASDVFGPPLCVVLRHEKVAARRLRYDPRIVIGPDWDFFVKFADVATFGYLQAQTGLYRVHRSNITAQVDPRRRAAYVAMCRENAIAMPGFAACSADVKAAVFYDLLVTLLRDQPARRGQVLDGAAFAGLLRDQQARLLRLTAADAMRHGGEAQPVQEWLDRARRLNPVDARAHTLALIHRVSPALGGWLLRALGRGRRQEVAAPFGDLDGVLPVTPSDGRAVNQET